MSVASRIESISEHLENAYNSLENIGVDLSSTNKNLANLSAKIESVYSNLPKTTGEGTDITISSTKKGKMELTLKGNTEVKASTGKNKLSYTLASLKECNSAYHWDGNSFTHHGITYTVNEDLSITANGTAEGGASFLNLTTTATALATLVDGTEYILNGCPAGGGSSSTYGIRVYRNGEYTSDYGIGKNFTYSNQEDTYFRINIANLLTVNNITFKPMLRLSSVEDEEYEPYTGGIASPNTNYPQLLKVTKGNNTLYINNENNWDEELEVGSYNSQGEKIDSDQHIRSKNFIPVTPNSKYKFSYNDGTGAALYIQRYNKNFGFIDRVLRNTEQYLTTTADTQYITFRNYANSVDTSIKIMMSKGESILPYVTHENQAYPINLGDIELCTIGDYEDYIYEDNGNWYKYNNIGKTILNGTENWDTDSTSQENKSRWTTVITNIKQVSTTSELGKIIASYYPTVPFGGGSGTYNNVHGISVANYNSKIGIYDENHYTDVTDFKTYLSTHNTVIYYVLNTPTTTQITNETLINQLNALKAHCKSYNNKTNILQTNDNLPFIITASALSQSNS